MNRFDLCVLIDDVTEFSKGTFAIILDIDEGNCYHLELWNFEQYDGASLSYLDKKHLRLATELELKDYQDKFKKYCDKNENRQS